MSNFKDPAEFWDFLIENRYRISTPIIASISVCLLLLSIVEDDSLKLSLCGVSAMLIFIIWSFGRSLPKAKKGKAILIAIKSEDKDDQTNFFSDFKEFFMTEDVKIELVQLPNYYAKKANSSNWLKFSKKTKCDFVLWGSIKKRNVKDVENIVLNLKSGLRHTPIDENLSERLKEEMVNTGANGQIFLNVNNEYLETQKIAEWINIYSRYLLIIAANLDGDYNYSITEIPKLGQTIDYASNKNGSIIRIKSKLKARLLEAYENKINILYGKWRSTRNIELLDEVFATAKKALTLNSSSGLVNFIAIYEIVKNNAPKKAIKLLTPYSKQTGLPRLNLAFCYVLVNNFEKAIELYESNNFLKIEIAAIEQIEEFCIWFLESSKDSRVYLILCLINFFGKEDIALAKKDYEHFFHYVKETGKGEKALELLQGMINK